MNKVLTILLILIILFASATVYFLFSGQHPEQPTGPQSTSSSDPCGTPRPTSNVYVSEYNVVNENSSPNGIAVDSSGNVWFVLQNNSSLGVLYSSNSTVRTFPIPGQPINGLFLSYSVVVDNTRNLVWFGDDSSPQNGMAVSQGIWSFDSVEHKFTFYNLSAAFPFQLFADKKGNVWFAESNAGRIGEIATNGTISQYKLPPSTGQPAGLAMDENGVIWFTVPSSNLIGSLMFTGNNYSFHMYNMTGKVSEPTAIAVDSGGNIWLTEHGPSLIAEFNPETNFFRAISTHIPSVLGISLPYFIYIDSSGNVWFNEHLGNAISRFAPSNDSLVEYLIPTQITSQCNISGSLTMNLSPNGTPWFTEWFAGKIGTVHLETPINVAFSFQNPSPNDTLVLSHGQSAKLILNVFANETTSLAIYLSTVVFNKTLGFSYSFSPSSGEGNFTSDLSITDQGWAAGTYYLTVSVSTNDIIFSRVIAISAKG